MADKKAAYALGLEAEERAANYFTQHGFVEVDRRAKMPGGEIDLIVENQDTLVCVEVKARSTISKGMEAVTHRQQKRIRTALRGWLAKHDGDGHILSTKTIRCDVLVVAPGAQPLHIPNAFPAADESGV